MKICTITELRRWAKASQFSDSWWYSREGEVSSECVKISDVPRDGDVHVHNADENASGAENWILFRYPGYETGEEREAREFAKKARNSPTPKQIVALEFFGHSAEGLTKQAAKHYLEGYFEGLKDSEGYHNYVRANRYRIYSGRELLKEVFRDHQYRTYHLRESVPEDEKRQSIEVALSEGIGEDGLLNFLAENYPHFFLKESTRKRKVNGYF